MNAKKTTGLLMLILCLVIGCSSGIFTRMDSTAPLFGPILVGMTRSEAEMHLGNPLMITPAEEGQYRVLYEYEIERDVTDTIMTDILDAVTFGMGNLVVSPADRFRGCEHLIVIQYQMNDQHSRNDCVVGIKDRVKPAKE